MRNWNAPNQAPNLTAPANREEGASARLPQMDTEKASMARLTAINKSSKKLTVISPVYGCKDVRINR
jgi:hypothetical protein